MRLVILEVHLLGQELTWCSVLKGMFERELGLVSIKVRGDFQASMIFLLYSESEFSGSSSPMNSDSCSCSGSWREGEIMTFPFLLSLDRDRLEN